MKSFVKTLLPLALAASLAAPALRAQREKLPPADRDFVEAVWPETKKTVTGIRYIIVREGKGDLAKPGDEVNVFYVGKLLNGTFFDKALPPDKPFTFRVRRDMVIEGWDQILQLMKPGERRLVIIPPELAYGTRGQPPKIGRYATLVFEMELAANTPEPPPAAADATLVEQKWPDAKRTASGLRYVVRREGEGASPKPGDTVSLVYTGRLLNGPVFDWAKDAERPFVYQLPSDAPPKGWEQILLEMKRGEQRLVIVPPELAAGTFPLPTGLGRNTTVVFELELLSFGKG